jgi:TolB-like protein
MSKSIARATAVLALVASPMLAQQDTRPTIAVLPFTNSAIGASNAELAPLSKGVADLLLMDLAQNTGIRVLERENIQRILDEQNLARDGRVDDATAARVGRLLGAKHMLTGSFVTDNRGQMRLSVRTIDSETGQVVWTHTENGKTEEFLDIVTKAGRAANAGLKLPALTPQARQTSEAKAEKQKKVPFQAVMLYSRAIAAQDAGNKTEAIQLFQQTIDRFPDFEDAKTAKKKLEGGT